MNEEANKQEDFASLYRRAFAKFGTQALWNMRPVEEPTAADAMAITKAIAPIARAPMLSPAL